MPDTFAMPDTFGEPDGFGENGVMPSLVIVAGPAGSGKTTTADALSRLLEAPHVDFDVVTSDVVADYRARHPELDEARLLLEARPARYSAFARAVATALGQHPLVIASAPLTSHVASGPAWQAWIEELPAGTGITLAWLDPGPDERLARMRRRGSERDAPLLARGAVPSVPPPAVPHVLIDVSGPPQAPAEALAALIR